MLIISSITKLCIYIIRIIRQVNFKEVVSSRAYEVMFPETQKPTLVFGFDPYDKQIIRYLAIYHPFNVLFPFQVA